MKNNPLLCCPFCPRTFHYLCAGMELRQRAPTGLWQCPACRRAEDGARVLDEPQRQRPQRLRAGANNTTLVPVEQPPQLLLAAPAAPPVVSVAAQPVAAQPVAAPSATLPPAAASVQAAAQPAVPPSPVLRAPTTAARPAAAVVARPGLKRPAIVAATDEAPRTRRRIELTGEALASGVNVVAMECDDFLPPVDMAATWRQPRPSGVHWIDRGDGSRRSVELPSSHGPSRACRNQQCRGIIWGAKSTPCPHCGMPGR